MLTFVRTFIQFLVCFFVLFNGYLQAASPYCGYCPPTKLIAITAGDDFSVALKDNGTVWTWGNNHLGKLGNGTTGGNFNLPGQVVTDSGRCYSFRKVIAISAEAGGSHTLALKKDGTVWAWGSNSNGQMGTGKVGGHSNVPVQVIGLPAHIVAIAAGGRFSLALTSDGIVYAWGSNSNGQLAISPAGGNFPVPAIVRGLPSSATAIAAGEAHALVILSNGHVWAWGDNTYGQVGNGAPLPDGNVLTPVPVVTGAGLTTATAIAAGNFHSLAISSDGTVFDWGLGNDGQLGDGSNTSSSEPVQVLTNGGPALANVTAIAGGGLTSYALTNNRTIWSWGSNSHGQLGHGTTGGHSNVAVHVVDYTAGPPFSDAIAIAGGNIHALTLKNVPRSVWAWGDNTFGELGNGTTGGNSNVPVETHGL